MKFGRIKTILELFPEESKEKKPRSSLLRKGYFKHIRIRTNSLFPEYGIRICIGNTTYVETVEKEWVNVVITHDHTIMGGAYLNENRTIGLTIKLPYDEAAGEMLHDLRENVFSEITLQHNGVIVATCYHCLLIGNQVVDRDDNMVDLYFNVTSFNSLDNAAEDFYITDGHIMDTSIILGQA